MYPPDTICDGIKNEHPEAANIILKIRALCEELAVIGYGVAGLTISAAAAQVAIDLDPRTKTQ